MAVIRASHRPVLPRPSGGTTARPVTRLAVQALAIGGAFVLGVVIALSLPGTARAAEPPTGAADQFLGPHSGMLTVDAANGVLVNDGGTGLEAELWTEPSAGTVLLAPDGGFSYGRTIVARTDEFSYIAADVDGWTTGPVWVRLRFANELPTCAVARMPDQPVAGLVEFDLGSVCIDVDGDPMTFAYQTPDIPAGSVWEADAAGHVRFIPPLDWVGTATVLFTAADGFGSTLPSVFAVEVVANE